MATSAYGNDPYELIPVARAEVPERVAYLRKLGLLTAGSLGITAAAAMASMAAVIVITPLQSSVASLILMLGGIYGAQFVGGTMLHSPSQGTRVAGFVGGSILQGVALGYLLLTAALFSADLYGNPFVFIGQAGGLVSLTVLGMVAYLLTGPRQLSMVGSLLSMLTLPMLGLMVITWIWPVGGIAGVLLSALFVAVSAGGLLYSLNSVMHRYSTNMVLAGAFQVSIGIVVLFWNVLVLLMRLQRR